MEPKTLNELKVDGEDSDDEELEVRYNLLVPKDGKLVEEDPFLRKMDRSVSDQEKDMLRKLKMTAKRPSTKQATLEDFNFLLDF